MFLYDSLLERLIAEDVPYGDLTTEAMGLSDIPAVMEFRARYDCTAAGVTEAGAVLERLGARVEIFRRSGSRLISGAHIMTALGSASVIHAGWKVAQNIMEYASGIATRTEAMVMNGRKINPHLVIACTRKSFPGGKTICMNAVQSGGGTPHRLGTSETFLLFANHVSLFDDADGMFAALCNAVLKQPEKKLAVECDTLEFAVRAASCGAGIIQFDKVKSDRLTLWVKELKSMFPELAIAAAGGINTDTVAEYAETGIDVAVTSYVYTGKPMDIEVKIKKARG